MITFDEGELEDMEWATLVLLGVPPSEIMGLTRQQIAMLIALHSVKQQSS